MTREQYILVKFLGMHQLIPTFYCVSVKLTYVLNILINCSITYSHAVYPICSVNSETAYESSRQAREIFASIRKQLNVYSKFLEFIIKVKNAGKFTLEMNSYTHYYIFFVESLTRISYLTWTLYYV